MLNKHFNQTITQRVNLHLYSWLNWIIYNKIAQQWNFQFVSNEFQIRY